MDDQEYIFEHQLMKIQELQARLEYAYAALKDADRALLYAKTILEFTDGISSKPVIRIEASERAIEEALEILRGKVPTRSAA